MVAQCHCCSLNALKHFSNSAYIDNSPLFEKLSVFKRPEKIQKNLETILCKERKEVYCLNDFHPGHHSKQYLVAWRDLKSIIRDKTHIRKFE